MLSSKKVRTAARAKKRTIAEQHDEVLERPRHSSIDDGVSPGVAAQLSGIMPVAVVVFTCLAFASLWRSMAECSEAAKALIRVELCPDDLRLAGMPQPPTFSSRSGQTLYWREAKNPHIGFSAPRCLREPLTATFCLLPTGPSRTRD